MMDVSSGAPGRPRYEVMVELVAEGEDFASRQFDVAVARGLGSPSLLPGWTRRHVISHLEGNARALLNLLTWAQTGRETPMYRDQEARAAEIESGTLRDDTTIVQGARGAADHLVAALQALPSGLRSFEVRTARGRVVPVDEVAWMRVRESWVHSIDLDTGASFDELPSAVVQPLLTEVVEALGAKPACPPLSITASDTGRMWRLGQGDGEDPSEIVASTVAILARLIGRSEGSAENVAPDVTIPNWL
jgi:maleylpyruvate isomerase